MKFKQIKKPGYARYNRQTCLNYYNEIEDYIKDSNNIPNSLKNNKKARTKTQRKRR